MRGIPKENFMSLTIFEYICIAVLIAAAWLHVINLAEARVNVLLAASEGVVFSAEQEMMALPEPVESHHETFRQRVSGMVGRLFRASSVRPTRSSDLELVPDFDTQEQAQSVA